MKPFTFHNPGKLVYGKRAVKKFLGTELLVLGARHPLIVTDKVLASSDMAAAVKDALGQSAAGVFSEVEPDTGVGIIDRAAEFARAQGADSIVSVGGGSSIDTGKAVAAMLGGGAATVRDLIGFYTLKRPPVPHAVIPTTAGTGSECTSMAVIKDEDAGRKVFIVDQKLIPSVGVLDPLMTVGLPPKLTAATGMDALTHAAESIMSTNAMPPADALALHAIGLIAQNLPLALEKGDDLEARSAMLIASNQAGQAFQNTLVGVVHAMAHALGAMFGVPHGLANAVLLAAGMEFNAQAAAARVSLIGKAMGADPGKSPEEGAQNAVAAMREFTRKIGIPERLSEIGVKAERIAECAALAMTDVSIFTNPRQPKDAEELAQLLRKCY